MNQLRNLFYGSLAGIILSFPGCNSPTNENGQETPTQPDVIVQNTQITPEAPVKTEILPVAVESDNLEFYNPKAWSVECSFQYLWFKKDTKKSYEEWLDGRGTSNKKRLDENVRNIWENQEKALQLMPEEHKQKFRQYLDKRFVDLQSFFGEEPLEVKKNPKAIQHAKESPEALKIAVMLKDAGYKKIISEQLKEIYNVPINLNNPGLRDNIIDYYNSLAEEKLYCRAVGTIRELTSEKFKLLGELEKMAGIPESGSIRRSAEEETLAPRVKEWYLKQNREIGSLTIK